MNIPKLDPATNRRLRHHANLVINKVDAARQRVPPPRRLVDDTSHCDMVANKDVVWRHRLCRALERVLPLNQLVVHIRPLTRG